MGFKTMYSGYMVQELIWSNRHLVLNPPKQGLALFLNERDRDKGNGMDLEGKPRLAIILVVPAKDTMAAV